MVYLSFDVEEFDVPIEYNDQYDPLSEGVNISHEGVIHILDILKSEGVRGTFFCTSAFASKSPDVIYRIVNEGHELASHGCSHSMQKETDYQNSKEILTELSGRTIRGYRQPQLKHIDINLIKKSTYLYDASLNPTLILGRYNGLKNPRLPYIEDGLVRIPSSVTPCFRIPIFWFTFHIVPLKFYLRLCKRILKKDYILNTYFHPWEFSRALNDGLYKIPWYIKIKTGDVMCIRFQKLIRLLKKYNQDFGLYSDLVQNMDKV